MALNVTLVVVGGDVKTPEVKLRLPSTVGRGRDCSIMLRHPLVSRQHCEIFEVSGALLVRDLGSLNGTFVNNQRIEGDAPLQSGQLLTIGTVTFRAMFDANDTADSPPDTPAPQFKTHKPSSETDSEGTIAARPTIRNVPPPHATPPTEPVEMEEDFDLDDAKPLFAEMPEDKTSEDLRKNGVKGSGAETVYSPSKAKSSPPAAKPAVGKAAEKVVEKPAAKPPEKPAQAAPNFGHLDDDEAGDNGEDDEDLNDFLKNLK